MGRYKAVRGTVDLWGRRLAYFRFIEETARKIFPLYHYEEVVTPIFEETGLFRRSIGEDTDIVEKEMYSFADHKGRSLSLRPEGTAPVVRAVVEHNLYRGTLPLKLFYFGPMFRYERPQAGRQRQFYHLGFEAIGSGEPSLDAEIITLAWQFFQRLGLKRTEIHLNNIGCPDCRALFRKKMEEYLADKAGRLCPDCRRRSQRNIFRLLDCKNDACRSILGSSPKSLDFLCGRCRLHQEKLEKYLGVVSLPFTIDKNLVRGLDYYSGTVFEVIHSSLGSQDALAGGGRYDSLVEELGGPSLPAIGFACGVERLIAAMEGEGILPPSRSKLDVYIITLGDEERRKGFELAALLRREGLQIEMGYGEKSLKAEMRKADKVQAQFIFILAPEELKNGLVAIKCLASGIQESVSQAEAFSYIKEKLKRP